MHFQRWNWTIKSIHRYFLNLTFHDWCWPVRSWVIKYWVQWPNWSLIDGNSGRTRIYIFPFQIINKSVNTWKKWTAIFFTVNFIWVHKNITQILRSHHDRDNSYCTFYIRKSAFLCEIYSNHHLMIIKMTILGLVKFQVKLKKGKNESEMRIYSKVIEVKRSKSLMKPFVLFTSITFV